MDNSDKIFLLCCLFIAIFCIVTVFLFHDPGIIPGILLVIFTIAVGAGTLRLMHVIRDL